MGEETESDVVIPAGPSSPQGHYSAMPHVAEGRTERKSEPPLGLTPHEPHLACPLAVPSLPLEDGAGRGSTSSGRGRSESSPPPPPKPSAPAEGKKPLCTRAYDFFIAQHLLVFLAIAFIWGLSWPLPGKELYGVKLGGQKVAPSLMIFFIFFISGMRLKTDHVMDTLKTPLPLLLSFLLILVVTPCVGFAFANFPTNESPPVGPANQTLTLTSVAEDSGGVPKEILIGFAIFCCVPTTLTSGAALVAQGAARATVLALMITSGTNLIGTVSVPFVLKLVLSSVDVNLNPVKILLKLLVVMLLPSVLGKVLTTVSPAAAKFAKDRKVPLTILSAALLVGTVWQSLSASREKIVEQPFLRILATIGSGVGLHLCFWVISGWILYLPYVPDVHHRRAVFLLASQKTLPVSVSVIDAMMNGMDDDGPGLDSGLIVLPCILGHLSQLVIDTFLINHWIKVDKEAVTFTSASPPETQVPELPTVQPLLDASSRDVEEKK
eukprot:Hpha_TRINITY_DN15223_c3_g1::TRINITY_DN15223_c3_g1_i4::g.67158::m.67158/K14347/SLC10A7, P7; solute carrier family 10 (sodium/bile acid cotransporter), member 7